MRFAAPLEVVLRRAFHVGPGSKLSASPDTKPAGQSFDDASLKEHRASYRLFLGTSSDDLKSSPWAGHQVYDVTRTRGKDGEITEAIYKGGMGEIYRGNMGAQAVAIKRCRAEGDSKQPKKECFIQLGLNSPFIVQCLGLSYEVPGLRGELCIILPWYEHTLEDALKNSQDHLGRWAVQLAKGIEYLHTLPTPILHGDMKASNVLIDENSCVKIIDFGLSRSDQTTATMSATVGSGTIQWQSPEIFRATPDQTFIKSTASDVWAFGCTLFEMYAGKHPWYHLRIVNKFALQKAIANELRKGGRGRKPGARPVVPGSRSTMPEEVWRVLHNCCWDVRVETRPSMTQIRRLLEAVLFASCASEICPLGNAH